MVANGYKQTEIGVIPVDWDVVTIDDVSSVISGGTPSTTVQAFWNGDINWFTPTEVGLSKYVGSSLRKITPYGLNNSSAKLLPVGTILLTTRAGIGDLAILTQEASTNQGFQSLLVNKKVDNEFFYYLVSTLKKVLLENASGSTFLEISPNKIKKINIPLPPKTEQKAIATTLSDVDELIISLESLIKKKENIKTATMQQLLTGKKRLNGFSEEWEEKTLFELADYKKNLFDDGDWIESEHISNQGVRLIQTGNIGIGKYVEKGIKKYIYENSFVNLRCKELYEGDLLICRLAEPAGRACILPNINEEKVVTSVDVTIFRPRENKANRIYLKNLFSTPLWFNTISESVGGTTHKRISRGALGRIKISIPSVSEQTAIAEILSDMDEELDTLKTRLEKTKAIKIGMMQELLTGKTRLI